MVGVLIITHGSFAEALISTAEGIVGPIENMRSVSVSAEDDLESIKGAVSKIIKTVDQGEGVILLTDMFGGTPSNIGLSFLNNGKVDILTGVNLPIVLKLAKGRKGKTLDELAKLVRKKGRESIVLASEMLRGKT